MANVYSEVETFMLVSARITPLFIGSGISPFSRIPIFVRAVMILIFSLSLSFLIGFEQPKTGYFALSLVFELMLGATFLLVLHAAFSALLFWGRIVDMQVGLGAAGVINPGTRSQDSLTGTFISLAAVTIFFVSGIHLLLVEVVVASFSVFNLGSFYVWLSPAALSAFWGAELLIAMMIFAPIMIIIWVFDIIVGMLSKTMPQMNIYFVTLPLKIAIGIFVLSLSVEQSRVAFEKLFQTMISVLVSGG